MLVKILWIIACFVPIINIWPCWKGTGFVHGILRFLVVIVAVLFWIPALIMGLLWAIKQ